MEFSATGWNIGKYLRLVIAIRDLTSGDWKILFVVIRLGVKGSKTARFVCFLELFSRRRGEKAWWDGLI